MEINLLTVVWNGIALIASVATLGDEIAVLVVAAEEGVEVVVDVGFDGGAAAAAVGGLGLGLQVALTERGILVDGQSTVRVNNVCPQRCFYFLSRPFQCSIGLGVLGQGATIQLGGDGVR